MSRLAPDGRLLYAASLYHDTVVVMNPQSGLVISEIKTGRRPYRILFHPSGKSLYVSSWADGSIGQYDLNGTSIANTRVAAHTTDMVFRPGQVEDQPSAIGRLFVSASNTNSVYSMSVGGVGRTGAAGNHQSRVDTTAAAGHDAERPGPERRWFEAVCGVRRCERSSGGGCLGGA